VPRNAGSSFPWLLLYTAFYKAFHEAAFPFLRWGIAETWHPALQFVAGFLAADFLFYCTHALKHRVTWIWRFRIHHSIEPRHRDKNFGERLAIWDWMFGTMYPHSDEYPETGLADAAYPLEASARGVSLFTQLWQQYVYPFRRILGSAGAR
jgi:sterol desaturase/sphingolipid hydroxylase (fatty acid hydroxylase superfamily)